MVWTTRFNIIRTPLIAILRGIKPAEVEAHINVLIDCGFDAIEIPLNSPNWQQSIKTAVKKYQHKALIGAGTVLKVSEVETLAQLGCQLIVTPNTNSDVIKRAALLEMEICPGCATATEALAALDAGAQNLKIFPSVSFGPSYIKALKAVLPSTVPVFAVGGITPDNLKQYIDAGCIGAGLGSDLYKAGQSVEQTRQKAEAFINSYQLIQTHNKGA